MGLFLILHYAVFQSPESYKTALKALRRLFKMNTFLIEKIHEIVYQIILKWSKSDIICKTLSSIIRTSTTMNKNIMNKYNPKSNPNSVVT